MIRFLPIPASDGEQGFAAYLDDAQAGTCTFRVEGYSMEFTAVDCDDPLLADGLLRAAMNCAANRGAYIARVCAGISEPAFRRLGFTGGDVLSAEIPEALTGTCGKD